MNVLLNLLNELKKRGKMRGLPSILSPFRNEFNTFNNTGAQLLLCFYLSHNIRFTENSHFGRENANILPSFMQSYNGRHYVTH